MLALYVTHPEVVIDPEVAMPRWGLSEKGHARAKAFATRGIVPASARIVSSAERKALDTAEHLAAGRNFESYPEFGENDRSATGYLPPGQFEAHVKELFGHPEASIDGWETANAAQARIVAAVARIVAGHDPAMPLVFVGHGCVGTLLKCHMGKRAIALAEDQRVVGWPGGGNCFWFDPAAPALLSDWQSFETLVLPA